MARHVKRERRKKEEDFNVIELEIIQKILSGKSIRELSQEYEGFGRTSIRNLLIDYSKVFPEYSEQINQRIYKNKTHRENDNINKINENSLTEDVDSMKNKKFYFEFLKMSEEEKKKFIFEKLNSRRIKYEKNEYTEELLDRKFGRLRKYFLEERNLKLKEPLNEEQFWNMLYDNPSLLAYSLSDKIKPSMKNLDEHPNIGYEQATKIVSQNSSILASSISRTNLQIKLLNDNNLLKKFLEKPRYFRTSPEMIYALICFSNEKKDDTKSVFITKERLKIKYGLSEKDLKDKYPIEKDERYANSEYFEK